MADTLQADVIIEPVVFADLFAEVVSANSNMSDGTDTHQSWTTDNDA